MPLIYLQDIRLNAVVEGPADAPPLLFCHALGTDLTLWDAVIPALAPRFRCIHYDARGEMVKHALGVADQRAHRVGRGGDV